MSAAAESPGPAWLTREGLARAGSAGHAAIECALGTREFEWRTFDYAGLGVLLLALGAAGLVLDAAFA